MPAQIVLTHDDVAFTDAVSRALVESGHEVMVFPDPLIALDALDIAENVKLVITSVEFPAGRSNGAALAPLTRQKRPNVKVLFVCPPDLRAQVEDLGEVLAAPAAVSQIVEVAARLLQASANTIDGSIDEAVPTLDQNFRRSPGRAGYSTRSP